MVETEARSVSPPKPPRRNSREKSSGRVEACSADGSEGALQECVEVGLFACFCCSRARPAPTFATALT